MKKNHNQIAQNYNNVLLTGSVSLILGQRIMVWPLVMILTGCDSKAPLTEIQAATRSPKSDLKHSNLRIKLSMPTWWRSIKSISIIASGLLTRLE